VKTGRDGCPARGTMMLQGMEGQGLFKFRERRGDPDWIRPAVRLRAVGRSGTAARVLSRDTDRAHRTSAAGR